MVEEAESPDRLNPLLIYSTPVHGADTPEKAKLLRIQNGADVIVRQLRETYAPRLAGLFWKQAESEESRLVLRLTGDEPVENQRMTVCGEPLTVEFVAGQMHMREGFQKLHSNNLEWFRGKFPGLQGTYAGERTGEIVLQIYIPEGGRCRSSEAGGRVTTWRHCGSRRRWQRPGSRSSIAHRERRRSHSARSGGCRVLQHRIPVFRERLQTFEVRGQLTGKLT